MLTMSEKCENLLLDNWGRDVVQALKDPIKFIRYNVNEQHFRKLRKQGKDVPIVMIKGTKDKPHLITSEEEKVSN